MHQCEKRVGKAAITLIRAVMTCHERQAAAAFRNRRGDDVVFDEEACEGAATDTFDARIAKLQAAGGCLPEMQAKANALRDVLLGDGSVPGSLEVLNAAIYCDSASGALIDPSGDDGGAIPSTRSGRRCAEHVTGQLAKLAKRTIGCHIEAGDAFQDGERFDEEGCERNARARFDDETRDIRAETSCPACLDVNGQGTLADGLTEQLETLNALIYLCPEELPGTTTTTLPTTTTTTTFHPSTTSTTSATSTTTTQVSSTTTSSTTHASTTTTSSTTHASTTTTTTSSTTTTTIHPVCGNGVVEPGETCDDGNTLNGDACPANCRIESCTALPATDRAVSVRFAAPPGSPVVEGITVFVDYPEGKVSLPGSGGSLGTGAITDLAGTGVPNDLDYALIEGIVSGSPIALGKLFTIHFNDCSGATAPTAGNFSCAVTDSSDDLGNTVPGLTCSVTIP